MSTYKLYVNGRFMREYYTLYEAQAKANDYRARGYEYDAVRIDALILQDSLA